MRTDKKFYSFETLFVGLAEALREFLIDNAIYYELSEGSFDMGSRGYHFEILADHYDVQLINGFLDKECIWHEEF